MLNRHVTTLLACLALPFSITADAAEQVSIATGSPGGLYHAAGTAICSQLAAARPGISCQAVASSGSVSNVMNLDPAKTQFAIVQADVAYNAAAGRGIFVGADSNLRTVLSLHEEAFTVAVKADSSIKTFNDLKGRRFSAGSFGTGTRETAEALFDLLGWSAAERAKIAELSVEAQAKALCAGEVDAISYLTGHPAASVAAAAEACPLRFVPLPADTVNALSGKLPAYEAVDVRGGVYKGVADDLPTVGLRATLVTSAAVPEELVRDLVAATFSSMLTLRTAAPALASLDVKEMTTRGIVAPLHAGALLYYKEHGLPTTSASVAPSRERGLSGSDGLMGAPQVLTLDPKPGAPKKPAGVNTAAPTGTKPDFNSVPVGPGQTWRLESGDFGNAAPALTGDGSLPDADVQLRLRMPGKN